MKYMPRMALRVKPEGRCVQQLCISVSWIQDTHLLIGVRWCVLPCRSRVTTKVLRWTTDLGAARPPLRGQWLRLHKKRAPQLWIKGLVFVDLLRVATNRPGVKLGQKALIQASELWITQWNKQWTKENLLASEIPVLPTVLWFFAWETVSSKQAQVPVPWPESNCASLKTRWTWLGSSCYRSFIRVVSTNVSFVLL